MINNTFRSAHARFDASQFRDLFAPRKPRHPLLRVALGLLGVALLLVLLAVGVVVGGAMLAIGLVRRAWLQRGKPQARGGRVVDAGYRVIDKPA
jgi:hypothetical protein